MAEKICGIYMIKNTVNNKVYIGQSIDIYKRWKEHDNALRNGYHDNSHLQRSYNKHNGKNFKFEIIETANDNNCLNDREKFWISKYSSHNSLFGYNKTFGGDNFRITPESADKIRQHHLGTKQSEETKAKISKAHMGKQRTQETKDKLSNYWTGKVVGTDNPNSKITEQQAKDIVSMLMLGLRSSKIAKELSISKTIINHIRWKNTWLFLTQDITFPVLRKVPIKEVI